MIASLVAGIVPRHAAMRATLAPATPATPREAPSIENTSTTHVNKRLSVVRTVALTAPSDLEVVRHDYGRGG